MAKLLKTPDSVFASVTITSSRVLCAIFFFFTHTRRSGVRGAVEVPVDGQREGAPWDCGPGGQRGWLVTEGCVHSDLQSLLLTHPPDAGGEAELALQAPVYYLKWYLC